MLLFSFPRPWRWLCEASRVVRLERAGEVVVAVGGPDRVAVGASVPSRWKLLLMADGHPKLSLSMSMSMSLLMADGRRRCSWALALSLSLSMSMSMSMVVPRDGKKIKIKM